MSRNLYCKTYRTIRHCDNESAQLSRLYRRMVLQAGHMPLMMLLKGMYAMQSVEAVLVNTRLIPHIPFPPCFPLSLVTDAYSTTTRYNHHNAQSNIRIYIRNAHSAASDLTIVQLGDRTYRDRLPLLRDALERKLSLLLSQSRTS